MSEAYNCAASSPERGEGTLPSPSEAALAFEIAESVPPIGVLWRIQDRDGRGPYRPGLPLKWADQTGPSQFPPFYAELGWAPSSVPGRLPAGYHCGCACRSREQLFQWFTGRERMRLGILGFQVVQIVPDVIVAETASQVLFGCRAPLAQAARTPDGVGRDPRPHPVRSDPTVCPQILSSDAQSVRPDGGEG